MMKRNTLLLTVSCILVSCTEVRESAMESLPIDAVSIEDEFWAPKMEQWRTVSVNYIMDKFEETGTLDNYDRVAEGRRNDGSHVEAPWSDGLVNEMIRAIADFQLSSPDKALQDRVDGYVKRIAAAQEADGYVNTYTQLNENDHRWGENGGQLRWQHDLYNAGALIDAGVHYFNATGKRELLDVGIKLADLICSYIGWAPKHDIVPGHALPEEAFVSLYECTGDKKYLDQTRFFLDARGSSHCGLDGSYAQDRVPVRELTALEGHAVRASLLMVGAADYSRVSGDTAYVTTCKRLWDNMVGRKMLLTGAIGSVAADEKFGEDWFIPVDAYAETCAGVGLAFFSYQMHLLDKKGMYVDELERALYNNVLGGIGADGTSFTYINPLNASDVSRWKWHGCPCCPPMFMKLMSSLPSMIYSKDGMDLFVNLYIGSHARVNDGMEVTMRESYLKDGKAGMTLNLKESGRFAVSLRVPGWSVGIENPFGLYEEETAGAQAPIVMVNGKKVTPDYSDGYATVKRRWKDGDTIEIRFPFCPRCIKAHSNTGINGKALALGPMVYCLEDVDNPNLDNVKIEGCFSHHYEPSLLGGINVIEGNGFTAIPCFTIANRSPRSSYKIWVQ